MTTIVKRTTKGSPLTHAEVDANFDNLNQFKVEQNAAGNVGLGGVTPSPWLAGGGFVQVPGNGFLGNNAGYSSNAMLFGSNAYCDTVWRYKSSGLGATFFQAGNGAFSWHIAASGTADSAISFTQAMTLDSAGNLGVGTNAPTSILDVSKNVANDTRITVQNGNAAGFPGFRALGPAVDLRMEVDSGNALASIGTTSNHAVRFRTNNAERLRIDASGNVGIGGAPSGWSAYKALQLVLGNLAYNGGFTILGTNSFYNGTAWTYQSTNRALDYYQDIGSGNHVWRAAASGTSGTTITWTQAMTLDASGNLGLGVTPVSIGGTNATIHVHGVSGSNPNLRLTNAGTGATASDGSAIFVGNAGGAGASSLNIYNYESAPIAFYTATTERMRIDASGNVGVGTASPQALIHAHAPAGNSVVHLTGALGATASNGLSLIMGSTGVASIFQRENNDLRFGTNNTERMRIDASGNVLSTGGGGLGYGTGSGGTVTQTTSKSTAVTLNKPTGRITTHNAALAAGASVAFQLSNTLIGAGDVIVVTPTGAAGAALSYSARAMVEAAGSAYIILKNETAGSLSDAVVLNFAIIKGATA